MAVLCSTAVALTCILLYGWSSRKPRFSFQGKHVLITGGTKGLGLELARLLVTQHQANVTICSRTQEDLDTAIELSSGRIQGVKCDVTDLDQVQEMIKAVDGTALGPVSVLICCAGQALCGDFVDLPVAQFKRSMDLNFMGSLYPTKLLLTRMLAEDRKDCKLVLVSSQAGMTGLHGYAAYSPSKYAVRGLAEALRHELVKHPQVTVHIAFPGNMDSPGYEVEQRTKPECTKKIEALESLQQPADVAKAMIDSICKGEYAIYGGNVSGYFLGRMSYGLAPHGTNLLVDMVLAPFLVIASRIQRTFILDRAHKW